MGTSVVSRDFHSPADNFTVSGIQPLAEGDLEWAGCVTVCGRLGREL